jgi:predicted PurR-regulated permease PerM
MSRTLIYIGVFVLILIVLIWYFSNIVIYVSLSMVFATLLRPLTNRISKFEINRRSIPRPIAILISYSAFFAIIFAFITLFIPLISSQIEVLSSLDFDTVYKNLYGPVKSFEAFIIKNNITDMDAGFLSQTIHDKLFGVFKRIQISELINGFFSVAGSLFVGFIAILFITFFLLYEDGILRRQVISIVPNRYFEVFISALYKIEKLLSNYLNGLLLQIISIFTLSGLGLTIMGFDYALTIAVFAAVANIIPYLGPIIGASFGVLVLISTQGEMTFSNDTVLMILNVLSVFAIVQIIDNIILQPLIFSKSVKAHPLEIFVIIFAGATIAGIPGMIAAIPVYTIVKVSTSEINTGFKRYKVFKSKN